MISTVLLFANVYFFVCSFLFFLLFAPMPFLSLHSKTASLLFMLPSLRCLLSQPFAFILKPSQSEQKWPALIISEAYLVSSLLRMALHSFAAIKAYVSQLIRCSAVKGIVCFCDGARTLALHLRRLLEYSCQDRLSHEGPASNLRLATMVSASVRAP